VPELTFAQPARRNLLVPVLIAFLVLGLAIALVLRISPHRTADLSITRTAIYPVHTVLKSESTVVGSDRSQDDLYILTTLRVEDNLRLPLFLKDFTATLTAREGQQFTTSAVEQHDLPTVLTVYPALKDLSSTPLLRETMVPPGGFAEGMVLLRFPVTQDIWDHRRTAYLNIDFYHQEQQSILIGRASEASSAPPASQPANHPSAK
jgi:hypothetical protein